jgi:hypothetical protein
MLLSSVVGIVIFIMERSHKYPGIPQNISCDDPRLIEARKKYYVVNTMESVELSLQGLSIFETPSAQKSFNFLKGLMNDKK